MDFIKRYWLVFIVSFIVFAIVLIIPILLNSYYMLNPVDSIFKEPYEWTKMWSGYIAAVISTFAAFIILFIQYTQNRKENERNRKLQEIAIKENHEENESNRKLQEIAIKENHKENDENRNLQIKIIKYQTEIANYSDLKTQLFEVLKVVNLQDFFSIKESMLILYKKTSDETNDYYTMKASTEHLKTEINNKLSLILSLRVYLTHHYNKLDEKEKKQKHLFELIFMELQKIVFLILDYMFLLMLLPNYEKIKNRNIESIKKIVNSELTTFNKIRDIIEDKKYDFYHHYDEIIQERLELFLDSFNIEDLNDAVYEILSFKEKQINQILE